MKSKKEQKREQSVNAAIKATDAFVKARGTTKFVLNAGDLAKKFGDMTNKRRVAGLDKYVPPHRRAAPNYGQCGAA